MPIKELDHTSFAFAIGEVTFIYKFFAIVDSDYTIIPCAGIAVSYNGTTLTEDGFLLHNLKLLNADSLIALQNTLNGFRDSHQGYSEIIVGDMKARMNIVGNFSVNLIVDGGSQYLEYSIAGTNIKARTSLDLHTLANIAPSINEHIRWLFTRFNYWDKFFQEYTYSKSNPDHQPLKYKK